MMKFIGKDTPCYFGLLSIDQSSRRIISEFPANLSHRVKNRLKCASIRGEGTG